MPPFGDEPAERGSGKISFLKHCVRDPDRQRPPVVTTGPFQPEPAEPVRGGGKVPARSSKAFVPFQDEGDEEDPVSQRPPANKKRKTPQARAIPFQDEPEEGQSDVASSSDGSGGEYQPKDTVFALGWQAVQHFVKGSFWKENMDERTSKPKRTYDNSKRSAEAVYARKENQGTYKANGLDPNRLRRLFGAPSCHCGLVVTNKVFLCLYDMDV